MINSMLTDMDLDSISDLTDRVKIRLSEIIEKDGKLFETICLAKQSGILKAFLKPLGLNDLVETSAVLQPRPSAKILVIGGSEVRENDIWGLAKAVFRDYGIDFDKRRFELHLEYEICKTYPFEKLQYNDSYCAVFIGPGPHSSESNGDYSSVINRMEQEKGFPPVVKLFANGGLKITKTNFRESLMRCIEKGIIA